MSESVSTAKKEIPRFDLSEFSEEEFEIPYRDFFLIVKSQDQKERRKKLIEDKKNGSIGRMEQRPIADGLIASIRLEGNELVEIERRSFKEPRGMCSTPAGTYLITEIGRVIEVDRQFNELRTFKHDFFGFLHSLDFNYRTNSFLVVSSGYDAVFEIAYSTGEVVWEWFGWENGMNPGAEGFYLVRSHRDAEVMGKYGIPYKFINPSEYNEQGLITGLRTTHPSIACYNPWKKGKVNLILGKTGEVIEVDQEKQGYEIVIDFLDPMPHGLFPHGDGWIITNTLKGEIYKLDKFFNPLNIIDVSNLGEKPEEMVNHEWIQSTIPIHSNTFFSLDANRGLILFDTKNKKYKIFDIDDNWCAQFLHKV